MNPARVPVVLKRNNAERAERPSKKQAVIDSAERPVQESQRLRIAYIHCPRSSWNRAPEFVSYAIENAVEIGATIINLVFNDDEDAKFL